MKAIRFFPDVPADVRAIEQKAAMTILEAIHRYAETGAGRVKPLSGEFEGLLRLRFDVATFNVKHFQLIPGLNIVTV